MVNHVGSVADSTMAAPCGASIRRLPGRRRSDGLVFDLFGQVPEEHRGGHGIGPVKRREVISVQRARVRRSSRTLRRTRGFNRRPFDRSATRSSAHPSLHRHPGVAVPEEVVEATVLAMVLKLLAQVSSPGRADRRRAAEGRPAPTSRVRFQRTADRETLLAAQANSGRRGFHFVHVLRVLEVNRLSARNPLAGNRRLLGDT